MLATRRCARSIGAFLPGSRDARITPAASIQVSTRVRNYSRESYAPIVRSCPVKIDNSIYRDLYQRWPKLYPRTVSEPSHDITVEYVDTALEKPHRKDSSKTKIVLALGGIPGYYTHFTEQINHFRQVDNVRVISPDWPKFEDTRSTNGLFWHSIPERLVFLKSFLRQLDISRIDCLIGHSFAIQTIGAFWENPEEINIRSVMLLTPQPNWTLDIEPGRHRFMKLVLLFKNERWYSFLERINLTEKLNKFMPIRFRDTNELLMSATHILDEDSPIDLRRRLAQITQQNCNIAISVVFGDKDTLIVKPARDELNQRLGIDLDRDVTLIQPEVTPVEEFEPSTSRIASYMLEGGGHFAHAKFSPYYNKMIQRLIDRE